MFWIFLSGSATRCMIKINTRDVVPIYGHQETHFYYPTPTSIIKRPNNLPLSHKICVLCMFPSGCLNINSQEYRETGITHIFTPQYGYTIHEC